MTHDVEKKLATELIREYIKPTPEKDTWFRMARYVLRLIKEAEIDGRIDENKLYITAIEGLKSRIFIGIKEVAEQRIAVLRAEQEKETKT